MDGVIWSSSDWQHCLTRSDFPRPPSTPPSWSAPLLRLQSQFISRSRVLHRINHSRLSPFLALSPSRLLVIPTFYDLAFPVSSPITVLRPFSHLAMPWALSSGGQLPLLSPATPHPILASLHFNSSFIPRKSHPGWLLISCRDDPPVPQGESRSVAFFSIHHCCANRN